MPAPQPITAELSKPRRYHALDGLRGFAAFSVFLFHIYWFSRSYFPDVVSSIIYRTPLAIFLSGHEAVAIFFVLSGFVISLPVLRGGRKFDWTKYYVSRLIRLYLPAAAAILYAGLLLMTVNNFSTQPWQSNTWLLDGTRHHFIFGDVLFNLVSLPISGSDLDNPLWTIRWEIYFSLLLPLFVGVTYLLRKYWYLLTVLAIALTYAGIMSFDNEPATQIYGTFLFGVIIAVKHEQLTKFFDKIFISKTVTYTVSCLLAIASILMLTISHMIALPQSFIYFNFGMLYPLGGALAVITVLYTPPLRHLFETRLLQFLGRISFSLYLIHVPLLVFFAYLFGPNLWFVAVGATLILGIPVAVLFQRFVEAPSHRFAKFAGKTVSTKIADAHRPR